MLKLRSIGLSDYSVLEGRQRIGRIRLATEHMPLRLALERRRSPAGRIAHGFSQGSRHGQGTVQGGLGSSEGQDPAQQLAAAYRAMNICDDGDDRAAARE